MTKRKPIPPFMTPGGHSAKPDGLEAVVAKGLSSIEDRLRDGRLYASDAAFCSRQAVLNATNPDPKKVAAAQRFYFTLGNAIEDLVLESLEKKDKLIGKQYPLRPDWMNLGGKIDGIILLNGRVYILEIKSCGNEIPDAPKFNAVSQAQCYSAITGLPAIVHYQSRNVASWSGKLKSKSFYLPSRDIDTLPYLVRAIVADMAIKRGWIPSKPSHIKFKSHCVQTFCDFVGSCWEDVELPHRDNLVPIKKWDEEKLEEEALAIAKKSMRKKTRRAIRRKMFTELATLDDKEIFGTNLAKRMFVDKTYLMHI